MKALSILQPWAWLILRPDVTEPAARAALITGQHPQTPLIKDIENRSWSTGLRGRILVHAGKTYSRRTHDEYAEAVDAMFRITLPAYGEMLVGGIVGSVEITGCVREHPSWWKSDDSWGFTLRNARPEEFRPYRGQLGFFDVSDDAQPITARPTQEALL